MPRYTYLRDALQVRVLVLVPEQPGDKCEELDGLLLVLRPLHGEPLLHGRVGHSLLDRLRSDLRNPISLF